MNEDQELAQFILGVTLFAIILMVTAMQLC